MMKEESTDLDLEAIHRRLNKIIGQCNGISRMIDRKAACADIILQVSAAKSALHRVGQLLLVNHLKECAREGVEKNHEDTKRTQGPGHFTVRPFSPHYRAHPLRFCVSLGNATTW